MSVHPSRLRKTEIQLLSWAGTLLARLKVGVHSFLCSTVFSVQVQCFV